MGSEVEGGGEGEGEGEGEGRDKVNDPKMRSNTDPTYTTLIIYPLYAPMPRCDHVPHTRATCS